jgi:hypothetical protein
MMKLDFRQGLLFVSVTLSFNGSLIQSTMLSWTQVQPIHLLP